MEQKRIPVFGKNAENEVKRAFDCILLNGHPYIETINRKGFKIMTPVSAAITALRQLQDKQPR